MRVADPPRIGITCASDHAVFSVVSDTLEVRGYDVVFLDPEVRIEHDRLDQLSLFVSKSTRPTSVQSLVEAERLGVPTWNSATGVQVCASRFSQLCALSSVGFRVPAATRIPPAGDYVAKGLYHWSPPPKINAAGEVYEPLLPADRIDHKYYVVGDGSSYHTVVLRATSKLWGPKRVLGRTDPIAEHVDRITSLMEQLEMRGLGVDLVRVDDEWYAVDINPCPSFAQTGLTAVLADSIETALHSQLAHW